MKKRILALLLPGLLLFSGCASMLERSYVSSTPHVDYSVTEDASILRAENYQGLVNSILYFVNEHVGTGTIRLYNYTGDVEADLANACNEVLYVDPLGAYAVRTIQYNSTRILTYYEVDLRIAYAHSASEVDSIREVAGVSGLRQELTRLVAEQREEDVLLASYFSGDAALIEELLLLARLNNPALFLSPDPPQCSVTLYPETGTRRIIELNVRWGGHSEEQLSQHVRQLEDAAALLWEANPPAGSTYTVAELAAIVRSSCGAYDDHGTSLPLDALSGAPANDTGLLLAMEYLCQQCGIEASMVSGTQGTDRLWLIVATPQGYRHLLPEALYPPSEETPAPPQEELPLYTDEQLAALGFIWPSGLHPACVDYSLEPAG